MRRVETGSRNVARVSWLPGESDIKYEKGKSWEIKEKWISRPKITTAMAIKGMARMRVAPERTTRR